MPTVVHLDVPSQCTVDDIVMRVEGGLEVLAAPSIEDARAHLKKNVDLVLLEFHLDKQMCITTETFVREELAPRNQRYAWLAASPDRIPKDLLDGACFTMGKPTTTGELIAEVHRATAKADNH
jgi:hypothetical protein